MRHSVGLGWLLAGLVASCPAAAQGIDCSKARSPTEKAICASPPLVSLDREVGAAYAAVLARQPERRDALRADQLSWLKGRDAACNLPPRAMAACLRAQLATRLADLAPPAAAAAAAARPAPAAIPAGTEIDPPPSRVPDPAIPPGTLPEPVGRLDQASLPASAPGETLLHVAVAGRFILSAKSAGGAALQLVDMLTGPSELAGAAGSQDGRMDPLLDVGTYKVRVVPAEGATGTVELSLVPFRSAAPPAALPQPGQPLAATLRDGEQRAFWLLVPPDGQVRLEAAGRSLTDLRLWRNGRTLDALAPAVTPVEPRPGHPLNDLRLQGKVEPGTYLLVAYGGRPATWTDGSGDQPLLLRSGASDALVAGWAGGPVGPFGSEVFRLPPATGLLRLQLPAPAVASLETGGQAAGIGKNSREPSAVLAVPPGKNGASQDTTVEVRAAEGQRFTLRALTQPPGMSWETPGTWWMAAVANGAGGDEVPPTVLLNKADGSGNPSRIVADLLPQVGPGAGWHARFNLRGPTTLIARDSGGPVTLRTEGVPVRGGPISADVPQGVYALSLVPQTGAQGAFEMVLGPPGAMPPFAAPLPSDPVLPLGVQALAPGERLRLIGGTAPGLTMGLGARKVPVALAEGPLAVTLAAGAGTTVPVTLAAGGTLSVTEVGSGAAPYSRSARDGAVVVPPADHARTVMLAWRPIRTPPPPIPPPTPPEQVASVRAGAPTFFDLADTPRSFRLEVAEGGLYRIETLGRLRTSGRLSTPFVPALGAGTANGVGQNMLIQRMLRAGPYQVEVSAEGSAGRAGLSATPAPLLPTGTLVPGGSVRATLPAGSGAAVPIEVEAGGTVHLDVASLGAPWTGRLEDAQGWPLTRPGPLDGTEQKLAPGRYRMVVEPAAVTRQIAIRLRQVEPPVAIMGHGPHPLPFGTPQHAVWREPDSQSAPRTPDGWRFSLAGPANVTLRLDNGMVGVLHRDGGDDRRVAGVFKGRLEAGNFLLDVTSLGRNDRAAYAVSLESAELQPDTPRPVTLPAKLPFAIATTRVVNLLSFGTTPVKAVLRTAAGEVIERAQGRDNDWNIAVSRPLPAGRYTLELAAAVAPDTVTTDRRDAPPDPNADSSDNSSTDGTSSDDGTAAGTSSGDADTGSAAPADDQDVQTAASQADDPVPASAAAPSDGSADQAPTVEVRLTLPPVLNPVPAPPEAGTLTGRGVHVLTLEPPPPPGTLVVAQAASAAALSLTLERQDGTDWRTVSLAQGTAPLVASPSDGAVARWRVRVWSLDGGPDPVRFAARALSAEAQPPGEVSLAAVPGMPAAVAAGRVAGATGLVRLARTGRLLEGGWPGHALRPATNGGTVPAAPDGLWLLGAPGNVEVTPAAAGSGPPLALSLPAGLVASLPAAPDTQLWIARAGTGQPSLGPAMGWAPGSAVALAGAPVTLGGGGGDGGTRIDLSRVPLTLAKEQRTDDAVHAVLPPGGALPVSLPAGPKRLQLVLAAGTGAVPGWHAPTAAVWAGDAPRSRTLDGEWTEVLLVNPGGTAAPVSLSTMPAPPEAPLAPGGLVKRFFGAAGSFEQPLRGAPGARLHLSGPGTLTVIDAAGHVGSGRDLAVNGQGRAIVSHRAGAVALWMDAPGAAPWPVAELQAVSPPARLELAGPAMALGLTDGGPVLLHVDTTAPVFLHVGRAGQPVRPAPFPAGAEISRVLPAGKAELRLFPPQDGPLTGTVRLRAEPILPVGEGLGPEVAVAPGGAAAFGFALPKAATIGVGIRAMPDRASARLLDETGAVVGRGVAQLASLPAGRYVLEAQVPAGAPTAVVRPALVGITPRDNGPPPDVVRSYLELAGMKPEPTRP